MRLQLLNTIKSQRIFKDSFWALLGSIIGKGLSLFGGILVARLLTKDIYGEYGLIKSTLLYIAVFSTFGLGFTSTRFISKYIAEARERVAFVVKCTRYITFTTSFIMALLLFIFAGPVAEYLDAPHLVGTLRISSVAIIFNAFDASQIGILSGFGAFKINARNNTIGGVVSFVLSFILTYFWGLNGAILALLLSLLTSVLLNYFSINTILKPFEQEEKLSDRSLKETAKELIKFSFPIALQEGLYAVTHWGTSIVLVKLVGYGEMGLYAAAGQWSAVVQFIPGVLRNVTLSHLSGNTGNLEKHGKTVKTMVSVNFLSTFLPWLGISLFSGLICKAYGDTYSAMRGVLVLTVCTALPNSVSNVFSQELISRGKNWFLLFSRVVKDVMNLVLLYVILSNFALPGAITAAAIAIFIQTMYLLALFLKYKIDKRRACDEKVK